MWSKDIHDEMVKEHIGPGMDGAVSALTIVHNLI